MSTELLQNEIDLFTYSLERPREDLPIEGLDSIVEFIRRGDLYNNSRFSLRTESFLLQYAYATNKILSLSNSRTRILAHQVESTHRIVNALNQRFLIADEVGLGKTIEAGLVIKEMMYRYNHKRIIIVCPASLLFQWQHEMQSKFNEHFMIMDRKVIQKIKKEHGEDANPWKVHNRMICSLDFIKSASFQEDLEKTRWDSVIFDEAHRLRRDSKQSTQAYIVAEILSQRTKSCLLLSATPFRGKLEELYFLLALLDKNILGPFRTFYNEYCIDNSNLSQLKEKISQIVIRRTKAEIGGFTKRYARTIQFDLYYDERFLYDETTKYVIEEFNRAMQTENRAVGFVMTVFQKLLDSSSFALFSALSNRVKKLETMVERVEKDQQTISELEDVYELEELTDSEDIDELVEYSLEKTVAELKIELKTLRRLVTLAKDIKVNKKGEQLLKLIANLKKKGYKKFLIFTQFRTTQRYLKEILSQYRVEVFHGSMNRDEKEDAITAFKGNTEILIATEAGGEGRNMQFCSVLINYDLPWSPLKIEQRIGRVHRFGQAHDVLIYNFSTSGTVAERVLEVLTNKLKLFEESIGTPDIMLGQIEDDLSLNSIFMEMAAGKKNSKDLDEELNKRIIMARESYEKIGDLTVADKMDFNYDEYYRVTLKERAFSNNRIESFIDKLSKVDDYSAKYFGKKTAKGLYPVLAYPAEEIEKKRYGSFDSEAALEDESLDFLAFGHPVVDNLMKYCQRKSFGGETGIRVIRHHTGFSGVICFYSATFKSKSSTSEVIPVITDKYGSLDSYDLDDAEKECMEQDETPVNFSLDEDEIGFFAESIDSLMQKNVERLKEKINNRILEKSDSLDFQLDPELDKIKKSYDIQLKELDEKLEHQECQMKWYGKDMKSALTRTRNKIQKVKSERDNILEQYRSYLGISCKVKVINAGVIISRGEE
jgi:ERCC4-related helicase